MIDRLRDDVQFDFLPQLPKDNLDDRSFEDLMAECLLRIPRFCPEWTDYNASDPGITLVELFAWLTDQMLLRFNKIPRRNYITFLELLGIRLQPPAAAHTRLTFYITQPDIFPFRIPQDTEVGTVRTSTQESIIFSTDRDLLIDQPQLRHFLTSDQAEDHPQSLRDPVSSQWTRQADGTWGGPEQELFEEQPQPGNCFYLVMEPEQKLEGNVLAIRLQGQVATPTGIDPEQPPRHWEAWNGEQWQPVLRREQDDQTQGFSFNDLAQTSPALIQAAEVILYMPEQWPATSFTGYEGRWLRCTYAPPASGQSGYLNSPQIVGLSARAIGGIVPASQSTLIRDELLGQSDGTPSQTFQLMGSPVLARRPEETLSVTPPGEFPQLWQEVEDFADSGPDDRHYTLDSLTGVIRFGPLIQEPHLLRQQTAFRANQPGTPDLGDYGGRRLIPGDRGTTSRQYGQIPPRGAEVRIRGYRVGGGRNGNVERGTLQMLRASLPYVSAVVNDEPARDGADAESLEQAVMRVPRMLRTRNRAVTKEDYETLTLEGGRGSLSRVLCLTPTTEGEAGIITVLVVPKTETMRVDQGDGISPEQLQLTPQLRQQTLSYLQERKVLGTQVQLQQPHFVGVSVETQVALEPAFQNPEAQDAFRLQIESALYRFLNPITGWHDGRGWPFGRAVYISDIVALLQQVSGVRYLGPVLMYELRPQEQTWQRRPDPVQMVDPGPTGLLVSWRNRSLRSSHQVYFLEEGGRY
ncbi:MAG: putative baseplate assembly protein [Cyanophyceae cyanobacterium]